jgi:predicted nucleic acid-binding protein
MLKARMSEGPYLFDVGVTALAHSDAPVNGTALSYVRQAISGEIDAVVPYASLIGAHNVLTSFYGVSNSRASLLMENFMDATRVHWYEGMSDAVVRGGFSAAADLNIGGWDGYYAEVAKSEGVETILTIDDDFERVSGVETTVILSPEEFATLNEYLGY